MFDFLSDKFSSIFSHISGVKKLTQDNIQQALVQVEEALLEADVPYNVVQDFITQLRADVVGINISASLSPSEQLLKVVEAKIIAFLGGDSAQFSFSFPSVVMVMGLQGSGKTTTIGKLAYKMKKDLEKERKKGKILLGSIDYYRPAAIEQLEILARKVGVCFYRAQTQNPYEAAKEIMTYARQKGYDYVFLDTAGRLHIDNMMLQELQEVDAYIRPTHKLLVLDAMTGQESLTVAKVFDDTVGFQAAIMTKMDSDTRGGAAFSFRYIIKKPIIFVGEGENVTDLYPFYPDRMAERILGKGDIRSLIERADEKIAFADQKKAEEALHAGTFTLENFADQMNIMNQLGSLSQLMKYMPNMGGSISSEMLERGEKELVRFRAIISSMTPKERRNHITIDKSRSARIAKGAGVSVTDVTQLLRRFEEAKQYVKLFNNFG